MAPSGQHYGNHTQFTIAYHVLAAPLSLAYLIWAIVRMTHHLDVDHGFALLGAAALFSVAAVSRLSPVRVQDRLIRLEERLRYEKLLTADVVARTDAAFSPRHYIALRFASDAELPGLVARVLANPAMSQKDIKQAVQQWRGDYFRV